MRARFPRDSRLAKDDLSGTCKNKIGARFTVATICQRSLQCETLERRWLQVRNQRRSLRDVENSMANGCSGGCDGGSDCKFEVTLKRDKIAKKNIKVMTLIPY